MDFRFRPTKAMKPRQYLPAKSALHCSIKRSPDLVLLRRVASMEIDGLTTLERMRQNGMTPMV